MPQPEQPHTILLVHCHYRLPGGEDAVFAAECAMPASPRPPRDHL